MNLKKGAALHIWHSKASNPFVNLKEEYNGIVLPEGCDTVHKCYASRSRTRSGTS